MNLRLQPRSCILMVSYMLVLASCTSGGESGKALGELQSARIEPGAGLGALRLNASLQSVTEQLGVGAAAAIITDDYWLELHYRDDQLVLLFALQADCRHSLESAGRVEEIVGVKDPDSFFAKHPACAQATLSSIALFTDDSQDPTFRSTTVQGIHLGSNRDEVLAAYGPAGARPLGVVLAGDTPHDDRFDAAFYASGIGLYLARADDGGQWRVKKVVIFGM